MSDFETSDDQPAWSDDIVVRITNGDGFCWGDTVEGDVTLFAGGEETITFATVSVAIVEQDSDGFGVPIAFGSGHDPYTSIGSIGLGGELGTVETAPVEIPYPGAIIARDITIAPGETEHVFPFSLTVPTGIAVTAGCFIQAHASATTGLDSDRHSVATFAIEPPRFIQAIQRSLATFGDFQEVERTDRPKADGSGYEFLLDYIAPDTLQQYIDGVKISLVEEGDEITGVVEINPQEHSFIDHLKAFLHADRIKVPVRFDRAELDAAGRAGAPSEAATQRLHELLDPFVHPVG